MEIKKTKLPLNLGQPMINGKISEQILTSSDPQSKLRFSDEELEEFRVLILSKLKEAKTDYDLLKGTLSRHNDPGTDDTSPTFKLWEDAEEVLSKEEVAQLALRLEKFIY